TIIITTGQSAFTEAIPDRGQSRWSRNITSRIGWMREVMQTIGRGRMHVEAIRISLRHDAGEIAIANRPIERGVAEKIERPAGVIANREVVAGIRAIQAPAITATIVELHPTAFERVIRILQPAALEVAEVRAIRERESGMQLALAIGIPKAGLPAVRLWQPAKKVIEG